MNFGLLIKFLGMFGNNGVLGLRSMSLPIIGFFLRSFQSAVHELLNDFDHYIDFGVKHNGYCVLTKAGTFDVTE